MHPQSIERRTAALATQPPYQAVVDRARETRVSPVAQLGQELMLVSVQQGNVPLYAYPEARIEVSLHGKVGTKKTVQSMSVSSAIRRSSGAWYWIGWLTRYARRTRRPLHEFDRSGPEVIPRSHLPGVLHLRMSTHCNAVSVSHL